MQTILLTGANGHLGSRLISRLVGKYKVLAVVRSNHASQSLGKAVGELDNLRIELVDYIDEARLFETETVGGMLHVASDELTHNVVFRERIQICNAF